MDERRFPRSFDSLEPIFGMIADFLRDEGLDGTVAFDLDLIAEELFTNMVKYGSGNEPVAIGLRREEDAVLLVLRDFDARPWDVTRPRALPDAPIAQRKAGGLGLHLVQRLADGLEYHHDGRSGTITVRKRVAP
ncbi:MAG TPA: ATP-binding protein [Candidatus Binatia bacterium]|nr:ATP-binding protein [Candidatus Binatia bacterium]